MKELEKLEKFIANNNLTFDKGKRNTNATILCGYAIHLNKTIQDCKESIPTMYRDTESKKYDLFQEIERVFDYASKNNYGKYWTTDEATKVYKF